MEMVSAGATPTRWLLSKNTVSPSELARTIETYAAPIPDEVLLKYDDAARTGLFSKFWVATPTYYQERQVDPWIVAEVDGADRWAVIARWD